MKLVVISYKVCWQSSSSASGYATSGGYPFQMQAIAELFDSTHLILLKQLSPAPPGILPLTGKNLTVSTLNEPRGTGWRRKASILLWLPRHFFALWRWISEADAVHALVPGDIGTLGILIALTQHKRLFIRHCGTWGYRGTLANRILMWLLRRLHAQKIVIMATGGGNSPPEPGRPDIEWIFSTTLTEQEFSALPRHIPWRQGDALRLVSVGRLSTDKNTAAIIQALPSIRRCHPQTSLDVVGDGLALPALQTLVTELKLADAVNFHGNVTHEKVLQILASGHIFVFPSRVAEGFPKSVLEAMACGLPVIAPPISVIPQLIKDRNGVLIQNTEPATIAAAVLELIADEARLQALSQSAQAEARHYTLERWQQIIGARLATQWGPLTSSE